MASELFSPLPLRSGRTMGNRIAKAAMEEHMAGAGRLPDRRLLSLYRRWAAGGTGLLITGNVMVHVEALTGPGGVVLDEHAPLEPFAAWAEAGKSGGAAVWVQINHPGRQVAAGMPGVVWGPSGIGVDLGRHSGRFGRPTAMTRRQIEDTVVRFAVTARRAEEAGFDGVEAHAAHGYLLSQFLSPLVDRRTDRWGGSPENPARLLLDAVRAVRAAVSASFAVAVKLDSADFQRGGFEADDARQVIEMLEPLGVDPVELSGGSYESPAMTGRPRRPHPGPRGLLPRPGPGPRQDQLPPADAHRRHHPARHGRAGPRQRRGGRRDGHRPRRRPGPPRPLEDRPRGRPPDGARDLVGQGPRLGRLHGEGPSPDAPPRPRGTTPGRTRTRRSPSSPSTGSSGWPCAATVPGRPRRGPATTGMPPPGGEGRARGREGGNFPALPCVPEGDLIF
ncbi:hypothetical protein [Streptomyces sp. NK15101]|uniref:oxidoreductase n=1 Tax=Streptomyces sp. NK15101 TaxID=2873261 RepID=UPI001CEC18AC|nr:hypothetical protein [Streptomyces sp. NK15101]